MQHKPILYFDMDNVLVDFPSGINAYPDKTLEKYREIVNGRIHTHYDDIPGIFTQMKPTPGAIEAVRKLSKHYDCYILSTSPWGNPTALNDKLDWIKRHFDYTVEEVTIKDNETNCGNPFYKRAIFSHHKNLCIQPGAWLIDDRPNHGADQFGDHHLLFGKDGDYPDWDSILAKLLPSD